MKLHTNPDGTTVSVPDSVRIGDHATIGKNARIGDSVRIGRGATIGKNARIGDSVRIGRGATIGEGATVGEGATICVDARIGGGARIGDRIVVGEDTTVPDRCIVSFGNSLHYRSASYDVDVYYVNDVPMLRYGCETHPLATWTPEFQAMLCSRHHPSAADDLAAAVRKATEFLNRD